jgi:hypothetical protein
MFVTARLTRGDIASTARAEAAAIKALPTDGRPLRIHIVGDAPTDAYARALARAVADWQPRGGGPVWAYTHAWREVARSSWGTRISVLASVETDAQVIEARARGYATARTVDGFANDDGRAWHDATGKVVGCPVQSGRTAACDTCKLCWDADRLFASNTTIAFDVHGTRVNVMRRHLAAVQGTYPSEPMTGRERLDIIESHQLPLDEDGDPIMDDRTYDDDQLRALREEETLREREHAARARAPQGGIDSHDCPHAGRNYRGHPDDAPSICPQAWRVSRIRICVACCPVCA